MTIKLGNIGRGEEATLEIQLIFRVDIVMGSYKFFLPADFYPDYRNLGAKSNLDYGFNFSMLIKCTKKITWLSLPPNSKATEQKSSNGRHFLVKCSKPTQELLIFYRSASEIDPQLLYAKDLKFPGQVAVSASFVPTFEIAP